METVKERINAVGERLTATERKLSATLLSDYPFAGLEPIQTLAERVSVSSPSVSRFVHKLGFQGYQEFQRQLIAELKEGQRSPIDLMRAGREVEGGYFRDFGARAIELIRGGIETVTEDQFQRVCTQLADPKRRVFVIGGRITDLVAQYLSRHLRLMRPDVSHLPPDPETWPEYLLRMRHRDVLFLVDFRRYQRNLTELAESAAKHCRPNLIVLTDKWLSPATAHASETLTVPVDSGTVWDSYASAFALTEAFLTRIAERDWDNKRERIAAWDSLLISKREQLHDG